MISELVYTSAPKGLFQGNTGFSVVGCTRNIDISLCKSLEKLSAYTPFYPHYDKNASSNPVNYAHRIIHASGHEYHILSRICFNGLDYTQRSNKLASHLAITSDETGRLACGPGDIFFQEGLFKDEQWQIKTEYFEGTPVIQEKKRPFESCNHWRQATGDAGWAGAIAESCLNNPSRTIYIVFDISKASENLFLLQEILSLLPERVRWQVSFSTYFTELPAGVSCNIRFCLPSCEELRLARMNPTGNAIVDLTIPLTEVTGGDLVTAARTGVLPEPPAPLRAPVPASAPTPLMKSAKETYVQPQQPKIFISRTPDVASKPTGWILSFAASILALLVLGGVFALVKVSDDAELAALNSARDELNEKYSESLTQLRRSLERRIELMKSGVGRKTSTVEKQTFSELRKKIDDFLDKKSWLLSRKKAKAKKDAEGYANEIAKCIQELQSKHSKAEKDKEFSKQEKALLDDIKEYEALVEGIGSLASLPEYNPRKKANDEKTETLKREIENLQALKKNLKTVLCEMSNDKVGNTLSVDAAWLKEEELRQALMETKKPFKVAFSDMETNAEIKSIYWDKDKKLKKMENGIYQVEIGGKKTKTLELKITVSGREIHIERIDKESLKQEDLKGMQFSILVGDGTSSKEAVFYLGKDSKLPIGAKAYFSVPKSGTDIMLKVPVAKCFMDFMSASKGVALEFAMAGKKHELGAKSDHYEISYSDGLPQDSIELYRAILNAKQGLEDALDKDKDVFPTKIKESEPYKKYREAKKHCGKQNQVADAGAPASSASVVGKSKDDQKNLEDARNDLLDDLCLNVTMKELEIQKKVKPGRKETEESRTLQALVDKYGDKTWVQALASIRLELEGKIKESVKEATFTLKMGEKTLTATINQFAMETCNE